MPSNRILIVEDDVRISRFLEQGLGAVGYKASVCETAESAETVLLEGEIELVVLDLMLPGISGLDLCERLRGQGVDTPILMLTAMDAVSDRVKGLRAGADDYLAKPFAFDELLARIEALLRRGSMKEDMARSLDLDDLHIDLETLTASRAGDTLSLTPKELRLLEYLVRNQGKVCTRAAILENIWNMQDDPLTNVVDVYISHLRQKVDHGRARPLIHTVRGFGYKADLESPDS